MISVDNFVLYMGTTCDRYPTDRLHTIPSNLPTVKTDFSAADSYEPTRTDFDRSNASKVSSLRLKKES